MKKSIAARLYFPAVAALFAVTIPSYTIFEFFLYAAPDMLGMGSVALALYTGLILCDTRRSLMGELKIVGLVLLFAVARLCGIGRMTQLTGYETIRFNFGPHDIHHGYASAQFLPVEYQGVMAVIAMVCSLLFIALNAFIIYKIKKSGETESMRATESIGAIESIQTPLSTGNRESIAGFIYLPAIIVVPMVTVTGLGDLLLLPVIIIVFFFSIYILRLHSKAIARGQNVSLLPLLATYTVAALTRMQYEYMTDYTVGIETLTLHIIEVPPAFYPLFNAICLFSFIAFIVLNGVYIRMVKKGAKTLRE